MQLVLLLLVALWDCANAASLLPSGVIPGSGRTVGYGVGKEEWRGEMIHLTWQPRAFLLKSFLSDEECDYLIKLAKPSMKQSVVVDSDTGEIQNSTVRTSEGMFLDLGQDDTVSRLEQRVAQVTMLPVENQEGFNILHYGNGQKYEPHHDFFKDPKNADIAKGGQRVLTVLIYLTNVEEGGESIFPASPTSMRGGQWSECARKGLPVKPFKGDALLFHSLNPDGTIDTRSLHGSCPVIKGDKWSATKWIRAERSDGPLKLEPVGPTDCANSHAKCSEWNYFGWCQRNVSWMFEHCRKSCRMCNTTAASIAAAGGVPT